MTKKDRGEQTKKRATCSQIFSANSAGHRWDFGQHLMDLQDLHITLISEPGPAARHVPIFCSNYFLWVQSTRKNCRTSLWPAAGESRPVFCALFTGFCSILDFLFAPGPLFFWPCFLFLWLDGGPNF